MVVGRLNSALARWRCRIGVAGGSKCGFSRNWPDKLNTVRCSPTKVKSKKLDTNAFLLDLAKFSRIWGGGGLIFYVKTSS